jgi:hypothetical protein
MTANNAIHQRRHLKVTSMAKALCGLVMASVRQYANIEHREVVYFVSLCL